MGGGGGQEVKYVGPSKEEIAQRQQEYQSTISLLQSQNAENAKKFDQLRQQAEQGYAERASLMQAELAKQKQAYDEVLGTTKSALQKSQEAQELQTGVMRDMTEKQQQNADIQRASAERGTVQAREQQALNRRDVQQTMNATNTRKKRRGLLSVQAR